MGEVIAMGSNFIAILCTSYANFQNLVLGWRMDRFKAYIVTYCL